MLPKLSVLVLEQGGEKEEVVVEKMQHSRPRRISSKTILSDSNIRIC
jgi:hypothetical protein